MNPTGLIDHLADIAARTENAAERAAISSAPPLYVTSDAMALIEAASKSMVGEPVDVDDWMPLGVDDACSVRLDTSLQLLDVPTIPRVGCLAFERPVILDHPESEGVTLHVSLVSWYVASLLRPTVDDPQATLDLAVLSAYGSWSADWNIEQAPPATPMFIIAFATDKPLRAMDVMPWTDADGSVMVRNGRPGWDSSQAFIRYIAEHDHCPVYAKHADLVALISTVYAFVSSEIVETIETSVNRSTRRRAGRAGTPETCRSVDLPHRVKVGSTSNDPVIPVDWSHRWWVRPHKRVLHRGTPMERIVKVRGYVKGPDGKPFVPKSVVGVVRPT